MENLFQITSTDVRTTHTFLKQLHNRMSYPNVKPIDYYQKETLDNSVYNSIFRGAKIKNFRQVENSRYQYGSYFKQFRKIEKLNNVDECIARFQKEYGFVYIFNNHMTKNNDVTGEKERIILNSYLLYTPEMITLLKMNCVKKDSVWVWDYTFNLGEFDV